MTRSLALAVVMIACGSKQPAGPANVPADILEGHHLPEADAAIVSTEPVVKPPAALGKLTVEAACTRFETLASQHCGWTQRFPADFHQGNTCITSLDSWIAPETPEHAKFQNTINCWALACEEAASCMVSIQANAAPPPPRTCGEEGTAPILVDAAAWEHRRGVASKRFAEVTTSVTEPIEACGIDGELEWLTRMTCNNGTNPYGSAAVAHEAHDAWLAKGGRCNSVLDRFSVKCPEETYVVYVDRYVCPKK